MYPKRCQPHHLNYLSNTVRVVEIDSQPWFLATDVCRVLGLSNPSVAILPLAADEEAKTDLGLSGRLPNIISESGLYKLIMRSEKPEARQFQDWVTREVLPTIRKDGLYVAGEEKVRTGEMSTEVSASNRLRGLNERRCACMERYNRAP